MPEKVKVKDPALYFEKDFVGKFECLLDGNVWKWEKAKGEYGDPVYFANEARKWANKMGKVVSRRIVNKGTPTEELVLWLRDPTEAEKKRTAMLRQYYGLVEDRTVDELTDETAFDHGVEQEASEYAEQDDNV